MWSENIPKILYQNRLMRSFEEIEAFEKALIEVQDLLSVKYIKELYNVFDDTMQHQEVDDNTRNVIKDLLHKLNADDSDKFGEQIDALLE